MDFRITEQQMVEQAKPVRAIKRINKNYTLKMIASVHDPGMGRSKQLQ